MNKLILAAALASTVAFAQETPPPPPPPPAATAAPVAEAPMEDPGGRVRGGISGNIGWHIPSMFTIGVEGRVGYVISNMFNAYLIGGYTAGFGFGVSASATGGSVSASAVGYGYLGAIAEFVFGNLFYVGAGPAVAIGGFGSAGISAGTSGSGAISAVAHSGAAPGLDVRLGLHFGKKKGPPTFGRSGFNLGLDVLTLLRPGTAVTRLQADASGAQISVTTNELYVTAAPMLTLGFDWR